MRFINNLMKDLHTGREAILQRRDFEKVVENALNRSYYIREFSLSTGHVVQNIDVKISKNVRRAYFDLFSQYTKGNPITHNIMYVKESLAHNPIIKFKGITNKGAEIELKYCPDKVILGVEYSQLDSSMKKPVVEGGWIITGEEALAQHTDVKTLENFKYNEGFVANHIISDILDEIQKEDFPIPNIPEDKLIKIPRWKEFSPRANEKFDFPEASRGKIYYYNRE